MLHEIPLLLLRYFVFVFVQLIEVGSLIRARQISSISSFLTNSSVRDGQLEITRGGGGGGGGGEGCSARNIFISPPHLQEFFFAIARIFSEGPTACRNEF